MKKTRTANLHHLYHEPLPENLKLTPKVEVDNVHQRQTTDVYEHALTITAWQQIYDQLHPGKFHGEFTEILLDDIQVFREYTGLALRQSCLVWPNSFWFGIPATRGELGFIGSQCLGSAEMLSRAREYVLENMSEPVTVLDLCNQLHVSRRTLQNAFHAILGIGPNAWLKRIRLNAVRRELISPWSQSTTVKDAAMQWGFWHLGQFATDYQQLFAEKPSLTLHQRMREWG